MGDDGGAWPGRGDGVVGGGVDQHGALHRVDRGDAGQVQLDQGGGTGLAKQGAAGGRLVQTQTVRTLWMIEILGLKYQDLFQLFYQPYHHYLL